MGDRDQWLRLLSESGDDRHGHCRRICELCVSRLDVTGAGLSVVTTRGGRGVVCATDDIAVEIEELQSSLGEGPGIDAVRSGSPVLVADVRLSREGVGSPWPDFVDGLARAGVAAVFAFPVRIGSVNLGALSFYRLRSGGLREAQVSDAQRAADAAGVAFLRLDTTTGDAFADDPQERTSYHFHVHQATGMVSVQLGVALDGAFLLLRARAFTTGRSLADVASDVVARRIRFSKEDV